jgi:hypothetical protein
MPSIGDDPAFVTSKQDVIDLTRFLVEGVLEA